MTSSLASGSIRTDAARHQNPKHTLLGLLARRSDLDALSVAQDLQCSPAAAGMLLLRLTRQGLIQRAFDPDDRVYFYTLTAKGRARLAYWMKIKQKQG